MNISTLTHYAVIIGLLHFVNHPYDWFAVSALSIESEQLNMTRQNTPADRYKERVLLFVRIHNGIIASYPNDKRKCVYYYKKDEYERKYLYRYDALVDKSEIMRLPIEATPGEYTDIWVSKNKRFIFVAAEYRYTDFIRIDTETGQIKYITDCVVVKRVKDGFKVVQSRCINESTTTGSADMEFAYTDYYYNEEGVCIGHGKEYTTSPY